MVRTVLFDLGNVLEGPLDPDAFFAELDDLAAEHGFSDGTAFWYHFYVCDAWEDVKRGRISRAAFWDDRFSALGVTEKPAQDALWQRIFQYHGLFPPMRTTLEKLHAADVPMSILSNTDRITLRDYLTQQYGIGHLFEHVISSAAAGYAKPDPEIYTHTLNTLVFPPGDILFIDDQERNTAPATALGVTTIVFNTPEQTLHAMKKHGLPVA